MSREALDRIGFDELKRRTSESSKAQVARELGVPRETLRNYLRSNPSKEQKPEKSAPAINDLRRMEAKLASMQGDLKLEQAKRREAERELNDSLAREATVEATRGKFVASTPIIRANSKSKSPATVVICANDWHAEENVDPDTCNGLNSFNLDICQKRLNYVWERALYLIDFASHVCDPQEVVFWAGGDLINGYIHEEMVESNFLGPAEAILFVQDRIAEGLKAILADKGIKRLRFIGNRGNHGRSTHRTRHATDYRSSWEYLAYHNVAKWFAKEPKFQLEDIAKGYHTYSTIQDHTVRFHHGDGMKYHGGVGGLTVPVNKSIAQWNKSKHADYDVFGHWHTFMRNWNWVSCGCAVGYNSYALSIKADFQPPTQTFLVFDKDRGLVIAEPIYCEEQT